MKKTMIAISMAALLAASSVPGIAQDTETGKTGTGGAKGTGTTEGTGITKGTGGATGTGVVVYKSKKRTRKGKKKTTVHAKKGKGSVSGRGVAVGKGTTSGTGTAAGKGTATGTGTAGNPKHHSHSNPSTETENTGTTGDTKQ